MYRHLFACDLIRCKGFAWKQDLLSMQLFSCGTCRTQLQMISQAILTTSKDSPQSTSGQLVESWCSMKEIRPNKTSLISLRRTGIKLPNKSQQKMSFEKTYAFCHVSFLGMVLLESWIIHLVSVLWSYWVLSVPSVLFFLLCRVVSSRIFTT